jgi:hypothetical protein
MAERGRAVLYPCTQPAVSRSSSASPVQERSWRSTTSVSNSPIVDWIYATSRDAALQPANDVHVGLTDPRLPSFPEPEILSTA